MLAMLAMLFYFTIIKMKYLTTLTTLFYLISIKINYLTSDSTLFYFTSIEWNLQLHLPRCLNSLHLKWQQFSFNSRDVKQQREPSQKFHFNNSDEVK